MTTDTPSNGQQGSRPAFPAPVPSEENQPYWDAMKEGVLQIQHCPQCDILIHPPRALCGDCGTWDLDWKRMSGRGTVYSYVVTRQAVHPSYEGWIPYLSVMVQLEEGPILASNLVDVGTEDAQIGMPVTVVFEPVSDEITVPLFKKA